LINAWLSRKTIEDCDESSGGLNCRVLAQNSWVGNVYWGNGKSVDAWKKLGFKSIHFLNSETLNLDTANSTAMFPGRSDDVVYLSR
jgi:hypothetical protein